MVGSRLVAAGAREQPLSQPTCLHNWDLIVCSEEGQGGGEQPGSPALSRRCGQEETPTEPGQSRCRGAWGLGQRQTGEPLPASLLLPTCGRTSPAAQPGPRSSSPPAPSCGPRTKATGVVPHPWKEFSFCAETNFKHHNTRLFLHRLAQGKDGRLLFLVKTTESHATAFNEKVALRGSALKAAAAINITETTLGDWGVLCVCWISCYMLVFLRASMFLLQVLTATEGCWAAISLLEV